MELEIKSLTFCVSPIHVISATQSYCMISCSQNASQATTSWWHYDRKRNITCPLIGFLLITSIEVMTRSCCSTMYALLFSLRMIINLSYSSIKYALFSCLFSISHTMKKGRDGAKNNNSICTKLI